MCRSAFLRASLPVLFAWRWDKASVEDIAQRRAMFGEFPWRLSEWIDTVPQDCRMPLVVYDDREAGHELVRIVAVDAAGQALLRQRSASAQGSSYSILPLPDARAYLARCRALFAGYRRPALRAGHA